MILPLLIKHFEDSPIGLVFRASNKSQDEVGFTGLSCILGSHTVELTWTSKYHNYSECGLCSQ